jgi:3-hydroxy acid dehydrogenase/malonic semialdehyde reductase
MTGIRGKRIVITGASAGIGAACAHSLAAEGAQLILWARRIEALDRLADRLEAEHSKAVHVAAVDVRDRAAVQAAASAAIAADGAPHVLVNNAGLARGFAKLHEGDPADWDEMIDTNIKGLLNVTRAFLPAMVDAGRGHVVNIGSTAGHMTYPKGNVYASTKYAVRALTEGMSIDLVETPVRVSSVDPGFVETEFSIVRFRGDEDRAKQVYAGFQPLAAEDIAEAVRWVIAQPEHVTIADMVITPTAQRNIYVVNREG